MNLIAESIEPKVVNLSTFEKKFAEGDKGELRFYLSRDLTDEEIEDMTSRITAKGVVLTAPITQDARVLIVQFQKAVEPLQPIYDTVASFGVGMIGWQLFSDKLNTTYYGIPVWGYGIGIVSIIVLTYLISRRNR